MKTLPLLSALVLSVVILFFIARRDDAPTDTTQDTTSTEVKIPSPDEHDFYSEGEKSRNGIGKFYQGREIAYVMGHSAIEWLERSDRETEESPTKALELLDLGESDIIADIGAGSGYHSLRIGMLYPKAKVISIDIQQEMLGFLEQRIAQLNLNNVETHLGRIESIDLPPASIDAVLMVDAYHEFSHPYEMMHSIVTALRPGGRVFLLEYRAEDPTVNIKPLHKMTQAQAIKEMTLLGLKWEKTLHDLPMQHFMIFRKP